MSDGSSIEWCDATWQPVVGCTRVSPGCDNCYAISTVHRFRKADGLTKLRPKSATRPGLDWTGKVLQQPDSLELPLRWKKPRRIFVCSQADLFHERNPFEFISAVFGVMQACRQHTFLVLTKRDPRPFFAWLRSYGTEHNIEHDAVPWFHAHQVIGAPFDRVGWPLPNVHLGVSVEDQARADERIPALLECPSAVHWISAEPLLGPVHLVKWLPELATMGFVGPQMAAVTGLEAGNVVALHRGAKLGWVVVGGESGPRARPFELDWARVLVRQCQAAGAAVFVKQLGARPRENAALVSDGGMGTWSMHLDDAKGGDMAEWPADLRVRELPVNSVRGSA